MPMHSQGIFMQLKQLLSISHLAAPRLAQDSQADTVKGLVVRTHLRAGEETPALDPVGGPGIGRRSLPLLDRVLVENFILPR